MSHCRSVLILRYDRIGDMIVTMPVIRFLKRRYPHLRLGVFASRLNAEIIRHDVAVNELYVISSNWFGVILEILRARRVRYDVVLNFIFNRTSSGGILSNLVAPHGVKVGQGDEKYRFYFNVLLRLERTSAHMIDTLAGIAATVFGVEIPPNDRLPRIAVDERSKQSVKLFLEAHQLTESESDARGRFVVFNVSATDRVRRLDANQIEGLWKFLASRRDYRTVVIRSPGDTAFSRIAPHLPEGCLLFPKDRPATLMEIAWLIESASGVLTPDTSIIHFASAGRTPVLGFFTQLQGMHEWTAYGVPHTDIVAPPGKPVSAIDNARLIEATEKFLRGLGVGQRSFPKGPATP